MQATEITAQATPRRRWALGALAATALGAGIGASWWRNRPAPDAAPAGLWARQWTNPQGESFAMQRFQGRPLLVNFWATWCPPCIEELPLIDAYYKANKSNGMQVVGLAVDQPSKVRQFLTQKPLSFPVGLAGLNGTELGKTLGNIENVLPYSLIFNAKGLLVGQKLGKLTPQDLSDWLKAIK